MGFLEWAQTGFAPSYLTNAVQDALGVDGDKDRNNRLLGKSTDDDGTGGGGSDLDSTIDSGGDQKQSGSAASASVAPVVSPSVGTGGASAAGNTGSTTTVEETNTSTVTSTVSPVTTVTSNNQSQSNATASQQYGGTSSVSQALSQTGSSQVVAPVVSVDLSDNQASLSGWQLAAIGVAAFGAIWLLSGRGKEDLDRGKKRVKQIKGKITDTTVRRQSNGR